MLASPVVAHIAALAWNDERYTHVLAVPLLAAVLIWFERASIFRMTGYEMRALPGVVAGSALCLAALWIGSADARLFAAGLGIALGWISGFVFCFGGRAGRAAAFPLGLLSLTVPLPPAVVEYAQVALQQGSAEVTAILFRLIGMPAYREGMVFALPGLSIEVARECSGIRAAISLLITALLLGHLFLRTGWRKAVCVALVVPIAIFKNAVRIAILSWLGVYVSRDYLTGDLHHRGGVVFSLISLGLLLPVLWALRRGETAKKQPRSVGAPVAV